MGLGLIGKPNISAVYNAPIGLKPMVNVEDIHRNVLCGLPKRVFDSEQVLTERLTFKLIRKEDLCFLIIAHVQTNETTVKGEGIGFEH